MSRTNEIVMKAREEEHVEPIDVIKELDGLKFRRAEDWERLTRLEYIVESLAKESARHSGELEVVVKIQRDMLGHLKTIKYTVVGGLVGFVISAYGVQNALNLLIRLFGV